MARPSSRTALWAAPIVLTVIFLLASYAGVGSWDPLPRLLTLPSATNATVAGATASAALAEASPPAAGDADDVGDAGDAARAAAVLTPGAVYSWSIDGARHALGRAGGDTHRPLPVEGLPGDVVGIAASGHSLAVTAGGEVWSWGRNNSAGGGGFGSSPVPDSGQIGARVPGSPGGADGPARVVTPPGVRFISVASGRYHSMALSDDGDVYTWGLNDFGQLGRAGVEGGRDGQATSECVHGARCRSGYPAKVLGLPRIASIAASRYASLAAAADSGRVWTWGADSCGVPRDGAAAAAVRGGSAGRATEGAATADGERPRGIRAVAHVEPREITWGGLQDVRDADGGYAHWVMRDTHQFIWTCDTGGDGYGGLLPGSVGGWQKVNSMNELGRYEEDLLPGRVPALRGVRVAAGRCFTLAVRSDGAVLQWGCSIDGGAATSNGPELVPGLGLGAALGRAADVAAAEWSAAALLTNGSIAAWGRADVKANVASRVPSVLTVPEGTAAAAISGAHQHFLAIVVPAKVAAEARAAWDAREAGVVAGAAAADAEAARGGVTGGAGDETALGGGSPTPGPSQAGGRDAPSPAAPPGGPSEGGGEATRAATARERSEAALSIFSPETVANVRALLPDVFANLGEPLDTSTNQCFKDSNDTSRLRCLPGVSILGVSKCGTTDLYHKLMAFPGFMGSRNKGPHYWDYAHPPDGGWEKYLELYDDVAALAATGQAEPLTCDASSATYSYASRGVRGVATPVPLPVALRVVQPTMKSIVMVRNPVDRFYSAFYYYGCSYGPQSTNYTAESFHVRAEREVAMFQACVAKGKRPLACAGELFHAAEQLVKGIYSVVLPSWLSAYPRTDFLLLRTESYAAEPRETILRVLDFLGVEHPPEALLQEQIGKRYNEGAQENPKTIGCTGKRQPMLPRTRALLEEFYAPFNDDLARIWGDPAMTWVPKEWKAGEPGGSGGKAEPKT